MQDVFYCDNDFSFNDAIHRRRLGFVTVSNIFYYTLPLLKSDDASAGGIVHHFISLSSVYDDSISRTTFENLVKVKN